MHSLLERVRTAIAAWAKRWFGRNKKKKRYKDTAFEDRRPFREGIKDMFDMHSGERIAFRYVTVGLLLLAAWVSYNQWFREPDPVDLGPMKAQVDEFIAAGIAGRTKTALPDTATMVPFDPNDLDKAGWMALGLSERQADGLLHWVERGGRFRSKADVSKMYSIPPDLFQRLRPFILLPDSLDKSVGQSRFADKPRWPERDSSAHGHRFERKSIAPVEVNSADTLILVELPGIGPSFARGIVKYRDRLGGYVNLDQLSEVFVLQDKPEAVAKLRELLTLDASLVRKINVNTCAVEDLTDHPYMYGKRSVARAIIAYRKQHGPFLAVEDIRKCSLVDAELFTRLAPYLTVE